MPLLLLLTVAGISGNWFRLPLFLEVEFLFGSIFALLALQFLGLGWGLLAAILISTITYQIWNHPFAIVVLSLEAAVVGWLYERRGMALVTADTLYWCLLGMPLACLFHLLAMHTPISSVALIVTKQALNGIFNALVARLIFTGCCLACHRERVSLREAVFNLLALFVLAPSLLLLTITSRADFNEADQTIRRHLRQISAAATARLRDWQSNRQHSTAYLAKLAETMPPAQIQVHLEQLLAADPNFLRIGLMDTEATAIAYAPPLDDLGRQTIGMNFADRSYFAKLRQTLEPQLSEIMPGRVGSHPGPIVATLSPVLVAGQFHGYIGGVLDLNSLKNYLSLSIGDQGMSYALLDTNDHVILSNDPGQKTMAPFSVGQGPLNRLEGGVIQWLPPLSATMPSMERWKKSLYITESDINQLSGWKLILTQPLAPTLMRLNTQCAKRLALLFVFLLVALALASLLSKKAHAALQLLLRVSSGLPAKIASGESIAWPESGYCETNQMIANFKEVSETLKKKFVEVNEMNATLEQRVAERTQSLQESEERYRQLFEAESDAIVLIDNASGRILEANGAASELYQYDHDEMLAKNNTDLSGQPAETKGVTNNGLAASSGLIVKIPLRFHRKKDGTVFPVEITGRFFMLHGRSVHIAAIRDITERKLAEEALKESEERFRKLLQHVPTVAVRGCRMDGTTFYWNDAAETLYGYTAQEAIGLNLLNLIIPPSMRSEVRQAMQQMATDGQPSPATELSLMRKDGSRVAIFSSHAIVQPHGREPELFYLDVDLTQIKQTEDLLRRALKEKEVLIKEVHHRVKNNMQVIYSLLNLQAKGITDLTVRTMFEESKNRVNSMALIHEKLYQAKDLAHINFKEYLQSLVQSIANTYNRPGITLSVEVDADLALDVNVGIPCGLIVNELVSNSLKHAFPPGQTGTIEVVLDQGPEGDCVLRVNDNGIGFPAGVDFRNTSSLGLQLVNVLTGQLHGKISLTQGQGSRFSITFPRPTKAGGTFNG